MEGFEDKNLQQRLYDVVDPFVMKYVRDAKGSVSAEHGIGRQKTKYLSYSKSPEMINVMQQIKGLLDPNDIMNPYKVLAAQGATRADPLTTTKREELISPPPKISQTPNSDAGYFNMWQFAK